MKDFSTKRHPLHCNRFTFLVRGGDECNFRFMTIRPAQDEDGKLYEIEAETKEWREIGDTPKEVANVTIDDQIVYMTFECALSLRNELNNAFARIENEQKIKDEENQREE